MFRLLICLGLISLALAPSLSAQSPRGMNAVDMVERPQLSQPAVSPDGAYLAFFKSETDWENNKQIKRLLIIDITSGDLLDTSRRDEDIRNVHWHPDSSQTILLKRPETGGKRQAFLRQLGTGTERQLTAHGEEILDVIWHPDGSGFYFITARQQTADATPAGYKDWLIPPYDTEADRELWWFDLETGESRPEIQGPFSIRAPSLSRDGTHLTLSFVPDHNLGSRHLGDVFVRNLVTKENKRWTLNRYHERAAQISPDNQHLAFLATVNKDGEPYYERKVFVQTGDGAPQRLLGDRAIAAMDFAWDQAGTGLYILANTGMRSNLFHLHLETETLRQITQGDHAIIDWTYDPGSNTHVARFETSKTPGEFQIMQDEAVGFVPVTSIYDDWLARFTLPEQTVFQWRGRGGQRLEGLLIYPLDYDPEESYPLVTITHGGPWTSAKFGSWQMTRYVPVLAAEGYLVFLPNHRGGTGYGDRFVRDMAGKYFRNAHHDILDGIDALVEQRLADPDRLIKMGWSAGGHMVNKLITHTDRFAAASSGAGAADWLSMHGESDIRHSRQSVFGGLPWQRNAPRRRYRIESPLKDVWKVTTPILFFTGENDRRVPPTQSILMHRGVRATGTPTVLYQAEDEGHNFRKPSHQLFKINTELAWYARFALGTVYEPVLPEFEPSDADAKTDPVKDGASSP